MIEWCFTPLSTVSQSYHGESSHYSCLSWVSPVLEMKSNFQATTKPKGLTCLEVFIFGTNISSSESVDPKSGCI